MTRARSLSQLANSNVFSVDANNSRVGIGSTIPDVKLDVGGDLYADNLTINNLIGVAATFSGVVSYEDVTNVDSVGIQFQELFLNYKVRVVKKQMSHSIENLFKELMMVLLVSCYFKIIQIVLHKSL
jgi:hypothetical protein